MESCQNGLELGSETQPLYHTHPPPPRDLNFTLKEVTRKVLKRKSILPRAYIYPILESAETVSTLSTNISWYFLQVGLMVSVML